MLSIWQETSFITELFFCSPRRGFHMLLKKQKVILHLLYSSAYLLSITTQTVTANPNTHLAASSPTLFDTNGSEKTALQSSMENRLTTLQTHLSEKQQQLQAQPNNQGLQNELAAIEQLYTQIQQNQSGFNRDIHQLSESIKKIPATTERLKIAKKLFKEQRYDDAINILDNDINSIRLNKLLREKKQLHKQQASNQAALNDSSAEFLLLAKLSSLDYNNTARVENTIRHYENALAAKKTAATLAEYALFLHKNQKFDAAAQHYQESINAYQQTVPPSQQYLPHLATLHNNFATLLLNNNQENDDIAAEKHYREALAIYRQLASKNPSVYQSYLNNNLESLSHLLVQNPKTTEEAHTLRQEQVNLLRQLSQQKPAIYQPVLAKTLHQLAEEPHLTIKIDQQAYLQEALKLYQAINTNSEQYSDDIEAIASTLLRSAITDEEKSVQALLETLEYQRKQAEKHPEQTPLIMAQTHNQLAQALKGDPKQRENVEKHFQAAIDIYRPTHTQHSTPSLSKALATNLHQLASFLADDMQKQLKSQKLFEESIALLRETGLTSSNNISLALALSNYAHLLSQDTFEQANAEKYYLEAIALYKNKQQLSNEQQIALAMTLSRFAGLIQHKQEDKAVSYYRQAIKQLQTLPETTSNQVIKQIQLAKAQNNLALLLAKSKDSQQNQLDEAITLYQAAIQHYRQLTKHDAEQHIPNLSNALGALANTYLDQKRPEYAHPLLVEATHLLKPYAQQHPSIFGDKQAYFLVLTLQATQNPTEHCKLSQEAAKLAQSQTLKTAIHEMQSDMKNCKQVLANK